MIQIKQHFQFSKKIISSSFRVCSCVSTRATKTRSTEANGGMRATAKRTSLGHRVTKNSAAADEDRDVDVGGVPRHLFECTSTLEVLTELVARS